MAFLQSGEAVSKDFLATGGVAGPVAVFADPDAPFVVENEGAVLEPADLAVLVLSSGRKVWLLRATLQSLSRVDGLRASQVLVSLAAPGQASQLDAIEEFGFFCAGFPAKGWDRGKRSLPVFQEAAAPGPHLLRSLTFSLRHFAGKPPKALVVLEEGQIFSLDLLWFFVQLLPVMSEDDSILCASAWNENGVSPYVADPTVVYRTDGFPPIAWMLTLPKLRKLLAMSKDKSWKDWLPEFMQDSKRQCLFPEVPRVALATADCLRQSRRGPGVDSAVLVATLARANLPVTAMPSVKCTEEEVQLQRLSARSAISGALRTHLGDARRLEAASFQEWFLWRWPGSQGMFHSKPVASVAELEAHLDYAPVGCCRTRPGSRALAIGAGRTGCIWYIWYIWFCMGGNSRLLWPVH
ncbi:unnamed protein product [Effrenium voratum]|uniref:Uncharacterized protein n=1 Tax=Effrenium voratum TaxID=2562239 RepID=A0AA36HJH1_9DINO|nr:unnamed protein product [Effrenium voratum]